MDIRTSRPRRRFGWGVRLATLAASLVLALLFAELILRLLGIGYGHAPTVGHPIVHHWHPANYQYLTWGPSYEFGGYQTYFNSAGMAMRAEPPAQGEPCLVFLGDSFTEAIQVPEEERFANRVASELSLSAVNLGCSSFCPLLERLALTTFAEGLSPKAVILQLFANDLADDARYRAIATHDSKGTIVAVSGVDTSWTVRLARRSYVARLIRKLSFAFDDSPDTQNRPGEGGSSPARPPSFTQSIEDSVPAAVRQGFEQSLLELRDYCRSRGWPLFVWVVPDRGSIEQRSEDYFDSYCRRFAERHDLTYIEMGPRFTAGAPENLFFERDGHFTTGGHVLAARLISDQLRRKFLP